MAVELYNSYHEKITLTNQQESCLNYSGNEILMVKGVAGAGKSLVLQALAKKLISGYTKDKHNKVVIFTFNHTLSSAVKEVLGINGDQENCVTVTTLNSYISRIYWSIGAEKLNIEQGKSCDDKRKYAVKTALEKYENLFGKHRFHNLDLQFWLDEFQWMKEMNVSVQDKDYYLGLERKGRSGKVRMSSADRENAFLLFTFYDRETKANGCGEWVDQALYLIRHPERIPDRFRFDHVLIDEAQDLSLTHMMAAMKLVRKDMVIAMDMNQRIYDRRWTLRQLGIEAVTKKLTKSMRTTKQIEALAESVRKRNDETYSEEDQMLRTVPELEGPLPKLTHLSDAAAEKKYVTELIRQYLRQKTAVSIGIIASDNGQVAAYTSWMTDAHIPHEIIQKNTTFSMKTSGVKIATIHNVKGLEFTRVIIPQFVEGKFPYRFQTDDEEEKKQFLEKCRNMLYVAMTRARYSLEITYAGERGSRFIGEMESALFEENGVASSSFVGREMNAIRQKEPVRRVGFINWYGNQEDHYRDVAEYARECGRMEQREARNQRVHSWFAGQLSHPEYAKLKFSDVMKLLMREYIEAKKSYESLIRSGGTGSESIDASQLWNDLWLFSVGHISEISDMDQQKRVMWMQAMSDKVFRLDSVISAEKHLEAQQKNRRYKAYMEQCFSLEVDSPMQFWRWIFLLRKTERKYADHLISCYRHCMLLMAFYLYQSLDTDAEWMAQTAESSECLLKLEKRFAREDFYVPEYRKLENPLCNKRSEAFEKAFHAAHVLLFHFKKRTQRKEGEIRMIEELYDALENGILPMEKVETILPDKVICQIEEGKLPFFSNVESGLIRQEEPLYYMDHVILYQGKEQDSEVMFRAFKGTVYITDQRLIFCGSGKIELEYHRIERVIRYDVLPELLEIICSGTSIFFQFPDTSLLYQVLKRIANKNRGYPVKESAVPFSYEELVEKADIGACIFAFEYIVHMDMPEELYSQIQGLIQKLRGLQKSLVQYPERGEDIEQFRNYYVPEAVKVVMDYQNYRFAGIDENDIKKIYEKILAAVSDLNRAVLMKISDIYHLASMDTIARAEALREILGQDGYSSYEINYVRK